MAPNSAILCAIATIGVMGAHDAKAVAGRSFDPLSHQQAWSFRASMGVGGYWGAPRIFARPVTVGAYAECNWVRVETRYGLRWQAVCE